MTEHNSTAIAGTMADPSGEHLPPTNDAPKTLDDRSPTADDVIANGDVTIMIKGSADVAQRDEKDGGTGGNHHLVRIGMKSLSTRTPSIIVDAVPSEIVSDADTEVSSFAASAFSGASVHVAGSATGSQRDGNYGDGYGDDYEGHRFNQSGSTLEVRHRKGQYIYSKAKEEGIEEVGRIGAGCLYKVGSKNGLDSMCGDIQSRMALELKARKYEEMRKRKEEEERIKAGGYKLGIADPIQGDIQSRMALELRARKMEEQRKRKEEEERIRAGGYKLGVAELIHGDIQSRMALELRARKAEEKRKRKEEEERIRTGGCKLGITDWDDGDIQSRMARLLRERRAEDQRKRREEERIRAGGYRAEQAAGREHGKDDAQSHTAQDSTLQTIEGREQQQGNDITCRESEPSCLEGRRDGVAQVTSAESSGSEGSLGNVRSRTALELSALEGKLHMARRLFIDRDGCGGGAAHATVDTTAAADPPLSPLAAELLALKGKKREAMNMFMNSSGCSSGSSCGGVCRTDEDGRRTSVASAASELSSLEGRKGAVQQRSLLLEDNGRGGGNGGSPRSVQYLSAYVPTMFEGKRDAISRQQEQQQQQQKQERPLHVSSEEDDCIPEKSVVPSSPVSAELEALKGKREVAARMMFPDHQALGGSLGSIQSRTAMELKALEGGMKRRSRKLEEAAEMLLTTTTSPCVDTRPVQSSTESELRALRGRTKEALGQFVSERPSSSGTLRKLKSRTLSELSALEGKRRDAEESLHAAQSVTEQGVGEAMAQPPLPLSKSEEREFYQVKKLFDLVHKDHRHRIGREDLDIILVVFERTKGKKFGKAEIDVAFEKVDEDKSGRISLAQVFQLYEELYLES